MGSEMCIRDRHCTWRADARIVILMAPTAICTLATIFLFTKSSTADYRFLSRRPWLAQTVSGWFSSATIFHDRWEARPVLRQVLRSKACSSLTKYRV